jgi:hypothetical protein
VRLGVGSLLYGGVRVGVLNDFTKFDNAIGADRLAYLGCTNLALLGSASVASIDVGPPGKGSPFASLAPVPAMEAATGTGSATTSDSSMSPFTAAPTFPIGGGCSIFSLQGFLALQLTPQSFRWQGSLGGSSRRVCHNIKLRKMAGRPFYAFIHGDYLGDPAFWKRASPAFLALPAGSVPSVRSSAQPPASNSRNGLRRRQKPDGALSSQLKTRRGRGAAYAEEIPPIFGGQRADLGASRRFRTLLGQGASFSARTAVPAHLI